MNLVKRLGLVAVTCLGLSACTSGGDPSSQTVRLFFSAETDTVLVNCSNSMSDLGTANSGASLGDLRFFIHDIVLRDIGGTRYAFTPRSDDFQTSQLALVDFTSRSLDCSGDPKSTNSVIVGTVQSYDDVVYTGVDFKIGVPASVNHADPARAESPLNDLSLHNGRTDGYTFMRLRLLLDAGGDWTFTLASNDCSGDPALGESVTCTYQNRPQVRLNNLDVSADNIVINISELLSAIDLEADANAGCDTRISAPGDDLECDELFDKLALNASGNAINNESPVVFTAD